MPPLRDGLVGAIIDASLRNVVVVLLLAGITGSICVWALFYTPVDFLPDLNATQVIVRAAYPGQSPQVIEDQVTFPLTSALTSVAGSHAVRGYSMFGDSFIYVIFEGAVDSTVARARVQDALGRVTARLPPAVRVTLGPDASGTGWVYEYALVDPSGRLNASDLRALQDWQIRFELQSVPGVAEVAAIGGAVKQYQVIVDPLRLNAAGLSIGEVRSAIQAGNRETGGGVLPIGEAQYMVRATGSIRSEDDLRSIPLRLGKLGVPLLIGDVADVRMGPELRRAVADLDGRGEVAGGVVIMSSGADVSATIGLVKQRLVSVRAGLPRGVQLVTTYDRSELISRAIEDLGGKILLEMLIVVAVCVVFLWHLPSALVLAAVLPLGVVIAIGAMYWQGVPANLMSLAGIAVAIGVMVDAGIVMLENAHRRGSDAATSAERRRSIADACVEVGPPLFFSLLVVGISFLPVLALQGEEGRLFTPLALTKTYSMLAAAALSLTLIPVLMVLTVRSRPRRAAENPLNGVLMRLYRPVLRRVMDHPLPVVAGSIALVVISAWPAMRLGTEFLPDIDEGDWLYMPTTMPGISTQAAAAALQASDRRIAQVPEVERVFGKAGRADSATDPAPLEMFETLVKLKPRDQWRAGMDPGKLRSELAASAQLPGLSSAWLPPIRSRIDMQATGVRTALALRVTGPDPVILQRLASDLEERLRRVPGANSVFSERPSQGRYTEISIDRLAAGRFGLNMDAVQDVIDQAMGGSAVGEALRGRERFEISLQYPLDWRNSLERVENLPFMTPAGQTVTLRDVARVRIIEGPGMIRSEDAQPTIWVNIDLPASDANEFVRTATMQMDFSSIIPPGYQFDWTGQFEKWQRASARLLLIVPVTLGLIVLMLYLNFRRSIDVAMILGSIPLALVGGVWLLWMMGIKWSVASVVGFIALAGLAVETGVLMLMYLNASWDKRLESGAPLDARDLDEAIVEGALLRLRPKLMTVATILTGLMPLLLSRGAGAEIMTRIAAPMVGGMISALLLTLLLIPALFLLSHRNQLSSDPR